MRLDCCGKNALRSKFAGQYGFALVLLSAEFQRCSCCRGKDPRKPKRFSWSVQGGSGGGKSKSPRASNCKPAQRLQFEEGEADSKDKRLREQRRLVPSRPFPTSSVFFWRSKRKCCAAVANLPQRISPLYNFQICFFQNHKNPAPVTGARSVAVPP